MIAQLRAVFCPSVQYLSFFCEGFSRTIWTVVAFSCFTVVKSFTSWYAIFIIIIIYPLTAKVVGAPQMISQPGSSIFSLLSTALWDLANSRLVRSLMLSSTSSSVCLVFFPLSLCLARWFWPDLMNGRHDHTTAVCVSLRSSGRLRVVCLKCMSLGLEGYPYLKR